MLPHSSKVVGFVPTLEALPVVGVFASWPDWNLLPCPSYGRVTRQLLAGQLSVALLPFEVFLSEIVSRPALLDRWCVPTVLKAAPVELVLSTAIVKQIQQRHDGRKGPSNRPMAIGIESRNSLTRHQFIAWQQTQPSLCDSKPVFRMLPMELMQPALVSESIDGFLSPTPWGIASEQAGSGRVVDDFKAGKLSQQLVLCSHRNVVGSNLDAWRSLPRNLIATRLSQLSNKATLDEATHAMNMLGRPQCESKVINLAYHKYGGSLQGEDFVPARDWLEKQIAKLSRLLPSIAKAGDLSGLAGMLTLEANHH